MKFLKRIFTANAFFFETKRRAEEDVKNGPRMDAKFFQEEHQLKINIEELARRSLAENKDSYLEIFRQRIIECFEKQLKQNRYNKYEGCFPYGVDTKLVRIVSDWEKILITDLVDYWLFKEYHHELKELVKKDLIEKFDWVNPKITIDSITSGEGMETHINVEIEVCYSVSRTENQIKE